MTEYGVFRQFVNRHNGKLYWGSVLTTISGQAYLLWKAKNDPDSFKPSKDCICY